VSPSNRIRFVAGESAGEAVAAAAVAAKVLAPVDSETEVLQIAQAKKLASVPAWTYVHPAHFQGETTAIQSNLARQHPPSVASFF
jgi:hypothetical protein